MFLKPALLALLCSFVLLCFLASAFAERPVTSTPETELQWAQFLQDYGRMYSSQEEADNRYQVFLDNLGHMQTIQELNPHAYFGVTQYFDLSVEEFVQRYATGMTAAEAHERLQSQNVTMYDDSVEKPFDGDERPVQDIETFDWRTKGKYVTTVKDQGQCGSCWAFSATELLESAWAIRHKSLFNCAPQMTLDCSGAGSCGGGYLSEALQWFLTHRVTGNGHYPYTASDGYCMFDNANAPYPRAQLGSYSQVPVGFLKNAIYKVSPSSFGIWGDMTILQYYQGGVITSCGTYDNGGHAMVITGWTTFQGIKSWIVRNSWGTGFGYDGYMYIESDNNACGIANMAFIAKGA